MKTYIIGFFVVIVSTLILDGIWLSTMMKSFYAKHLGSILADKAFLTPAFIFYIIYTIGILYFVSIPLYKSGAHLSTVFLTGALFGLIAYATYDLTNHATIKDWPAVVTLVDLTWGAFLTGTTATCAVIALRTFL